MSRLEGKAAVVTGAGSGIGEACAVRLGSEGASVLVADINGEAAERVAQAINDSGGNARAHTVDVGRRDEVDGMFQLVEEVEGIDVLVNNAGVLRLGRLVDTTDEDWDITLRTNLSSVFYCCRGAARRMIEQGRGGRIVSISSIHAVVSEPNGGAYTASKGGIEALSRTIASELAPHAITVNCVRPGATWTPLSRPFYTPEIVRALHTRIPLKEIAQPEWIAGAVSWFASDDGRYSTGTTLDVDGGYIMDGSLPELTY